MNRNEQARIYIIAGPNGDPLASSADAAFVAASRDVIARARLAKTEIVVWREGQVVTISPDEAELELAAKVAARGKEIAE